MKKRFAVLAVTALILCATALLLAGCGKSIENTSWQQVSYTTPRGVIEVSDENIVLHFSEDGSATVTDGEDGIEVLEYYKWYEAEGGTYEIESHGYRWPVTVTEENGVEYLDIEWSTNNATRFKRI